MRTALASAIAATAALGVLVLPATGASASTPGCTSGPWLGYCGTQVNDLALVIDSQGQSAAYGNPVIGWTDSTSDVATDFFQLAYAGDSSLGVMFQYAPGGVFSGMCLSDPGNLKIVLRPCNGSNFQRWTAVAVSTPPGDYAWYNRANNLYLTTHGKGGQLTDAAPAAPPSAAQEWKFSS
jgi:hypothetical protein